MKNSMKHLFITATMILGLLGIVRAEETEEVIVPSVSISGEFSSDFTFGESTSFSTPYTGLNLSGDGWVLNTNLSDGNVNVEEANYSWSITEAVTLTFGSQAEPYGLAWGLHRPSNNQFVSTPRDHSVTDGVGVSATKWGVDVNFLYGSEEYWATRVSYNFSQLGIDSEIGLSSNSNEAQLVDVSLGNSLFSTSLEYDLSEEADGAYWLRGVVTPPQAQGAFLLIGYNSDEVVTYGVGYKCSDNMKVVSEFTSGLKDAEGNEVTNDFSIRASYSF